MSLAVILDHAKELQILPWNLARLNGEHLLQCTDCARLFKRPSGLASHRRAFPADALGKTPEQSTKSSSEQCGTTTCKTQQSVDENSRQNLHSADDCVEDLTHGPNVSHDDIADIPLLNRLIVPSAKCNLFRTKSDQALGAVLEKECRNFDQLLRKN